MNDTLYCLIFSMILTTVICSNNNFQVPDHVMNLNEFCISKKYVGECKNWNRRSDYYPCHDITCATGEIKIHRRKSVNVGNAPNGLTCGLKKVCYNGSCRNYPPFGRRASGNELNIEESYVCWLPNVQ